MTNDELKTLSPEEAKEYLIKREQELIAQPIEDPRIQRPDPDNPNYKSLGRIDVSNKPLESSMPEIGWKAVPTENLPSKGIFYPSDAKIRIRSAKNKEIRHFSTIDEEDILDIDDKLNYIVENCAAMTSSKKPLTSKDLLEIDRLYLLFCIRDYTFPNNENKLNMQIDCDQCGHLDTIEITRERLNYFNMNQKLMDRYDPVSNSFKIQTRDGLKWNMYMPTIGTTTQIKNIRRNRQMNGLHIDPFFFTYASFMFPEWRQITEPSYKNMEQESQGWSTMKISIMKSLVDLFKKSIDLDIKHICSSCGSEVSKPFTFQGGWKALFLLADEYVFDQLI